MYTLERLIVTVFPRKGKVGGGGGGDSIIKGEGCSSENLNETSK